jgi:hypothetical protein
MQLTGLREHNHRSFMPVLVFLILLHRRRLFIIFPLIFCFNNLKMNFRFFDCSHWMSLTDLPCWFNVTVSLWKGIRFRLYFTVIARYFLRWGHRRWIDCVFWRKISRGGYLIGSVRWRDCPWCRAVFC